MPREEGGEKTHGTKIVCKGEMRDEKQGGVKHLPVILLLSPPLLLGAVDWDIRPHMGSTTISVKFSNSNMAAPMRWSPCYARVTPVEHP